MLSSQDVMIKLRTNLRFACESLITIQTINLWKIVYRLFLNAL